jgi:hypothetical protein
VSPFPLVELVASFSRAEYGSRRGNVVEVGDKEAEKQGSPVSPLRRRFRIQGHGATKRWRLVHLRQLWASGATFESAIRVHVCEL